VKIVKKRKKYYKKGGKNEKTRKKRNGLNLGILNKGKNKKEL